jgi:2-methylisocitrate lyase-like PEP mutase family enzyme
MDTRHRSTPESRSPSENLRSVLAEGTTLLPGVWDPLSTRLAARAGHRAVFVSGYCVAGTLLGVPDIGILTQTEMADAARRICAAVPDVAVIVDADTGYGDALTAIRTTELWESAGAAGMFLEDQVWPKRCGHMSGKQVVEREDWLGKLRAVLDHRRDLHLTARTDARGVHGLNEAIERAKMARDLGVDAVFVEAPQSVAELEAIATAVKDVTLVANMVEFGMTPLLNPSELGELGFHMILSPVGALFSATAALQTAYQGLADEGTLRTHLNEMVTFSDFTSLVGLNEARATGDRY